MKKFKKFIKYLKKYPLENMSYKYTKKIKNGYYSADICEVGKFKGKFLITFDIYCGNLRHPKIYRHKEFINIDWSDENTRFIKLITAIGFAFNIDFPIDFDENSFGCDLFSVQVERDKNKKVKIINFFPLMIDTID